MIRCSFAKILLTGQQGDIIYNSFVNNPVELKTDTNKVINVKVTDSKEIL